MSFNEKFLSRQANQAATDLEAQLTGTPQPFYEVQLGRTPLWLPTFEHTKIVADRVLQKLGDIGGQGIVYDESATLRASVNTGPVAPPFLGLDMMHIGATVFKKPVATFRNPDLQSWQEPLERAAKSALQTAFGEVAPPWQVAQLLETRA